MIEAWADAPSEEDTGARWVEPLGTVLASATVGPGSSQLNAAEEFAKMSLSAGFGGWIKVLLKVTQGSTAASPLAFTISVDLSVKE